MAFLRIPPAPHKDPGPRAWSNCSQKYYVTQTLLSGDPDTNSRHVYRLRDHKLIATFNCCHEPWGPEDRQRVQTFIESLEAQDVTTKDKPNG